MGACSMKWLIQILFLVSLFMFVRGILRTLFASKKAPSNFKSSNPFYSEQSMVKQGKMEKDPVCGTYVDVDTALQKSFSGKTLYFCSSDCLEKFKASH